MRSLLMANFNLEKLGNGKFRPKRKKRSTSRGIGTQFLNVFSGNCLIQMSFGLH